MLNSKSNNSVHAPWAFVQTRSCVILLLLFIIVGPLSLAGDRDVRRLCGSEDLISFSIDHQNSIRVCKAIPIHISVFNIAESQLCFLEKIVISTTSRGKISEIEVYKELQPIKMQLDEFCRECTEVPSCEDKESCGELYSAFASSGYTLSTSVELAADAAGTEGQDVCAGEEISIGAYVTVGGKQIQFHRTLPIQDFETYASLDRPEEDQNDAILYIGRLPHPPGWFAGDQHEHTSYEKDAGFCIWEWPDSMSSMISAAISMDLNWQFFTDHSFGIDGTIWGNAYNECTNYNNQHPGDAYRCLYGEEVSSGERSSQFAISHYVTLPRTSDNLGFSSDGCSWTCNYCNAEQLVINDINNKGGMGFIAHPYDNDFSWFDWNVSGYRGMEVLNSLDGAWGTEDDSSLNKWLSLISSGAHTVGVSDSDAHNTEDVGYTFTYCDLPTISTANIRSALEDGRCVFGNGPLVYFEIDGKKIGDTLIACPGTRDISVNAYSGDSTMGYIDKIRIFVNGFLRDEISFTENLIEFHGTRQLNFNEGDSSLYFHIVNRGASRTFKAYTNPLWLNINNGPDNDGDTYTTCENDCNDNDEQTHPGAQELCDSKDNDCDGTIDEGFVTPGETTAFSFETDKQTMHWNPEIQADRYDVVKGDLLSLRLSAGDFTSSLMGCLENNSPDTETSDPNNPEEAGQGFYYIVRAQNCQSKGTYNSGQAGQMGDRDSEIEASSNKCP